MSNSNIAIIYVINAPDIWISEKPLYYRILSDVIQGFSHVTLQRIPTSDVETHTSEVKFSDLFFFLASKNSNGMCGL